MEDREKQQHAIKLYNSVNNSFKKKIIFHVGVEAGFYSEINNMLIAMLYCYVHRIKFILYADDASFAGEHGWNEFFVPFCPQNHDKLNQKYNGRYREEGVKHSVGSKILKVRNCVNYLTSDIFSICSDGPYGNEDTYAKWDEFGINGDISQEFTKLRNVALRYNRKTFMKIKKTIRELKLPDHYCSVQFRGGDKTLEVRNQMNVDCVIARIKESSIKINNIFIFTDDFSYIEEIREKCPEWEIYTLTKENEHGYNNAEFCKVSWALKHKEMIKLFAMVEICIHSDIHFGCEVSCANDYIKNVKEPEKYRAIWTEDDAMLRTNFGNKTSKQFRWFWDR